MSSGEAGEKDLPFPLWRLPRETRTFVPRGSLQPAGPSRFSPDRPTNRHILKNGLRLCRASEVTANPRMTLGYSDSRAFRFGMTRPAFLPSEGWISTPVNREDRAPRLPESLRSAAAVQPVRHVHEVGALCDTLVSISTEMKGIAETVLINAGRGICSIGQILAGSRRKEGDGAPPLAYIGIFPEPP